MASVTIIIAFIAGILSFLSPCILPIIPGFMAFLSGSSGQTAATISRKHTFISSIFFVLGFSIVFAILGVILNTALGSSAYYIHVWLSRLGGLIIIIFGLHITGLIQIPFLMMDHKIEVKKFNNNYITSLVFGASFAVGWSPCVGAILGSVFALAVSQPTMAFVLLMAYALGLGVPFLIVGWFTEEAVLLVKKSGKILKYFNIVVGTLLIILGILVFTNNLNLVASFIVPQGLIQ